MLEVFATSLLMKIAPKPRVPARAGVVPVALGRTKDWSIVLSLNIAKVLLGLKAGNSPVTFGVHVGEAVAADGIYVPEECALRLETVERDGHRLVLVDHGGVRTAAEVGAIELHAVPVDRAKPAGLRRSRGILDPPMAVSKLVNAVNAPPEVLVPPTPEKVNGVPTVMGLPGMSVAIKARDSRDSHSRRCRHPRRRPVASRPARPRDHCRPTLANIVGLLSMSIGCDPTRGWCLAPLLAAPSDNTLSPRSHARGCRFD